MGKFSIAVSTVDLPSEWAFTLSQALSRWGLVSHAASEGLQIRVRSGSRTTVRASQPSDETGSRAALMVSRIARIPLESPTSEATFPIGHPAITVDWGPDIPFAQLAQRLALGLFVYWVWYYPEEAPQIPFPPSSSPVKKPLTTNPPPAAARKPSGG
ncbi:hypothetical protein TPY_2927 [Sulfobacillus acidophilus TPY]|nr:hypothetical protein TPY_2927 [Sulfobacillus acidophilus TPY]